VFKKVRSIEQETTAEQQYAVQGSDTTMMPQVNWPVTKK
jgi:hypothetical protein